MIHKKCSKLNKNDIKNFHTFKGKWECASCLHEKYPFTQLENEDLNRIAHNSNIKCHCSNKLSHVVIDNKLKLLLTQSNQQESWNAHNLQVENEFEQHIEIKPNFKYYEIHDFHKLNSIWKNQTKHMFTKC